MNVNPTWAVRNLCEHPRKCQTFILAVRRNRNRGLYLMTRPLLQIFFRTKLLQKLYILSTCAKWIKGKKAFRNNKGRHYEQLSMPADAKLQANNHNLFSPNHFVVTGNNTLLFVSFWVTSAGILHDRFITSNLHLKSLTKRIYYNFVPMIMLSSYMIFACMYKIWYTESSHKDFLGRKMNCIK